MLNSDPGHRCFFSRLAVLVGLVALFTALPGSTLASMTASARDTIPGQGRTEPAVLTGVSVQDASDGNTVLVRFHLSRRVVAFSRPRLLDDGAIDFVLFGADPGSSPETPARNDALLNVLLAPSVNGVTCRLRLAPGWQVRDEAFIIPKTNDLGLYLTFVPPVLAGAPNDAPVEEQTRRWLLDTIVLDAGHGGRDPGAVANGYREKDITLATTLALGRLIEEELGIRVVYTRDTDVFVPLSGRGRLANEANGKLFISIHTNAATSSSAEGTETFFLGMHKSAAAREVVERENAVIGLENDRQEYAAMSDRALIMRSLAQAAYMHKSEELAQTVEESLSRVSDSPTRGVKQAGFYVLWSAGMPSILVELGFLTNRREASLMASRDGQASLARAILESVRRYKDQYERELILTSAP